MGKTEERNDSNSTKKYYILGNNGALQDFSKCCFTYAKAYRNFYENPELNLKQPAFGPYSNNCNYICAATKNDYDECIKFADSQIALSVSSKNFTMALYDYLYDSIDIGESLGFSDIVYNKQTYKVFTNFKSYIKIKYFSVGKISTSSWYGQSKYKFEKLANNGNNIKEAIKRCIDTDIIPMRDKIMKYMSASGINICANEAGQFPEFDIDSDMLTEALMYMYSHYKCFYGEMTKEEFNILSVPYQILGDNTLLRKISEKCQEDICNWSTYSMAKTILTTDDVVKANKKPYEIQSVNGKNDYDVKFDASKDIRSSAYPRSNIGSKRVGQLKNIFYLKDYKWTEESILENSDGLTGIQYDTIPKMILYEFQPNSNVPLDKTLELFNAITESFNSKIFEKLPFVNNIKKGGNRLTYETGANTVNAMINSGKAGELANSIEFIADKMKGDWVGKYEIPFFGSQFLSAKNSSNWSMGNALDGQSTLEVLKDFGNANILDMPVWKPGDQLADNNVATWETEFYLINDTFNNLQKNFEFLYAFTSSSYWVQLQEGVNSLGHYQCPNLFRVECPGRFIQLYVALDINVEFVGKIRNYASYEDFSTWDKNVIFNQTGRAMLPDGFKITINAKDLTPQCFNVVSYYLSSTHSDGIVPKINTKNVGSSNPDISMIANIGKDYLNINNIGLGIF